MDKKQAYEVASKFAAFLRARHSNITHIYLFGSYAKGGFNDNSDIDLAIIFDALPNTFDMQVELMKLRRRFDTRLEPHPLRDSEFDMSNPFASEILRSGIEIN